MSCLHYQSTDPTRDRSYHDGQYARYASATYTPRIQTPETCRSGYCAGWRTLESQGSNVETPTAARGDPAYPDSKVQTGWTAYKQDTTMHGDHLAIEKIQTKLKFLENSNIVMQTRNQNLITENKTLLTQLKEEQNEVKRLERKISSLRAELDAEKLKLEQTRLEAERATSKKATVDRATGMSSTNLVTRIDRGIQIWAVCKGCQKKLEGCEKQPPTVTITKSELEVLEKDMQTLRDTIIAREEAWDKAMEREQNYRQQLTRLTTETITARHLSETRYEELKTMTDVVAKKQTELKSLQKENLYLNKLIAKLRDCYQREQEGCNRDSTTTEMNEKDQRFIEDVVQRMSSEKSKPKSKSKSSCSEKVPHSGGHQSSPRDRSTRTPKDQSGPLKESKR